MIGEGKSGDRFIEQPSVERVVSSEVEAVIRKRLMSVQ